MYPYLTTKSWLNYASRHFCPTGLLVFWFSISDPKAIARLPWFCRSIDFFKSCELPKSGAGGLAGCAPLQTKASREVQALIEAQESPQKVLADIALEQDRHLTIASRTRQQNAKPAAKSRFHLYHLPFIRRPTVLFCLCRIIGKHSRQQEHVWHSAIRILRQLKAVNWEMLKSIEHYSSRTFLHVCTAQELWGFLAQSDGHYLSSTSCSAYDCLRSCLHCALNHVTHSL